MRKQHGFTLIELMIVIAIIAIIAAIAIPNLLAARLRANETAAIATLRNLSSAQSQFQQGGRVDVDFDGTGECGGFLEMSGGAAGRMAAVLVPPVLSGGFRTLTATQEVSRGGYLYKMYLPGPGGGGVPEAANGTFPGVDVDLAETTWCCYAWPVGYNQTGNRTFFTNLRGDITSTEDPTYTGPGAALISDAAFLTPGINGNPAIGALGQDGNLWTSVH